MIFLLDGKDTLHGPIKSWDTLHVEIVKKLILTDGNELYADLAGYDFYLIDREMVSHSHTARSYITRESIIGIHDLSRLKNNLLQLFNVALKKAMSDNKNSRQKMNKVKEVYDLSLEKLKEQEINILSLGITQRIGKLSDIKIDTSRAKKGVDMHGLNHFFGEHYARRFDRALHAR